MIVVDSSVWIASLRGERSEAVRRLEMLANGAADVLVGDLILLEILQGALSEDHASALASEFTGYGTVSMSDEAIALASARNYRRLRSRGVTLRSTMDLVIATFCIEREHELLHQDRDFDPCERYLGLRVLA